MKTPIEQFRETLTTITGELQQLKAEVQKNGFTGEAEEIHFFRHTKPHLHAQLIYASDHYAIENNKPAGTPDMLREYYEQELLYIFRLFRIHAFHYQYYRTGATILDNQYFLRGGQPSDIPTLDNLPADPVFSTPLDYLFAKFIAAERLRDYLLDQLSSDLVIPKPKTFPVLRWTGEAINLVEVAYGIWLTGQLNEGNATITDIVQWLEEKLAVKIGIANRRWTEISGRTHNSPTKYLDRMREAIQQRLDEERGTRDRKRKARRTN